MNIACCAMLQNSVEPSCKLSRQDIERNESKYMTTNGLCIRCLQKKDCCPVTAHPSIEPSLVKKDLVIINVFY